MGMFDFLKKTSSIRDLITGMVGSLLKAKATNEIDDNIIEIFGGLRNQGYAERQAGGVWQVSLYVDEHDSPEKKIDEIIEFLRAWNRAVTWVTKHGGPYPGNKQVPQ